ncbi:hypothetical protein ACFQFC_06560 [Amorphoplanes digitatis]|uniref:Integral membrane protein n=1 Tax=Actinoplanes digitatis TaxID=1868 RepID=A0A7W7HZW8_9ACTN|nr:hypothetical protein [Actinoplanes digitatis]MBB4763858.1 hypothetical protein [Actinoplanes digitatis]BFE73112.1 hypothetical protein GCM10020092_064130 [Actinoplanes digitatis]GID95662.1 hypothetical protein Adi01nite_50740 [Actinoplanes digitatis]
MTQGDDAAARVRVRPEANEADFAGAIYGSMLAASVVVGGGLGADSHGPPPVRLALLLVATGVVFWLAHAYARLVGDRIHRTTISGAEIVRVARLEWPLLQATFPPAAAAVVVGVLGGGDRAAGWAALLVAIAGQVGWGMVAARQAGASRSLILLTAVVNLALGLVIISLKAALQH